MRKLLAVAMLAAAGLSVAAVQGPAHAIGEKAVAEIKGRDGKELGTVTVVETTSGVLVKLHLKGLPPGPHGFHLHESRKCEGDFSSAGAIYNPLGAKHGFLNDEGPMAGDMPNIYANALGEVELELLSPFVTLNKESEESVFDTDGTSVVIFEKADDYVSVPEGNAGARIACGSLVVGKGAN
mgnify:CR=1 FL=1